MTPVTEIDQLKQQNAMLLKRLLLLSRERDQLLKLVAALEPRVETAVTR